MNVAIYGAGAMGTVLGAYLAKAGYEIDLVNRNKDHVDAMNRTGAKVIGKANFVQPVRACLPDQMGDSYDIILLMTKQRDNKKIAAFLEPHLSERGVICTMQNGIPEPVIADVIGADRTIGCTMSWGATFHGRGVAELTSEATPDTLTFAIGKYGDVDEERFAYIVKMLSSMGQVTVEENFIGARWAKLMINAAFSGLSVVTGATFGALSKECATRRLAVTIIKECIDVAHAAGIKIEPIQGKDVVKLMYYKTWIKQRFAMFILPFAMRKHKNIRSSMLRDIERGRETEVDAINGVVAAYGDKYGVDTPLNDKVISVVRQIEAGELVPDWKNIRYFIY